MKARATRRVSGPRPAMNPPETPSPSAGPAASNPTSNPTPNPTWGILWMLLTMFGFVSMDAMAKHLSQDYSTVQIVWARFTFHAVFLAAWLGTRFWHQLKTHRIGLQLGRSLVLMTTTATYFGALAFIPLADASAIMMLSPIIVTALSAPLLGEQAGPRRWAGVCDGCVGALLIVRPGGDVMHWAALLAVTGIEVPKALVDMEVERLQGMARQDLAARGIPVRDDMPLPADMFEKQAQRRVSLGLILAEVVVPRQDAA